MSYFLCNTQKDGEQIYNNVKEVGFPYTVQDGVKK